MVAFTPIMSRPISMIYSADGEGEAECPAPPRGPEPRQGQGFHETTSPIATGGALDPPQKRSFCPVEAWRDGFPGLG
jgi:hypothetical protein